MIENMKVKHQAENEQIYLCFGLLKTRTRNMRENKLSGMHSLLYV